MTQLTILATPTGAVTLAQFSASATSTSMDGPNCFVVYDSSFAYIENDILMLIVDIGRIEGTRYASMDGRMATPGDTERASRR